MIIINPHIHQNIYQMLSHLTKKSVILSGVKTVKWRSKGSTKEFGEVKGKYHTQKFEINNF